MAPLATVRRGADADASAIAEVYLASRRGAAPRIPLMPHTDAEVRDWFASVVLVEHEVWVAERAGQIVGVMVMRGDSVDQLYVRPDAQRRGIGAQLLDVAKQRHGRLRLYTFEANEPARDFYEKHGFTAVAFGDGTANPEGAPDVLYEWRRR
jgi:ribosomal protein S18 acetylase RimI-like enzyme